MDTAVMTDLEAICRSIFSEGSEIFRWAWDDRYDAVLATISSKRGEEARAILEKHLFGSWDYRQIHMAPHDIRRIAELIGGIGEQQVVLSSDPDLDVVLVCGWWPWSNGQSISIRIGIVPLKPDMDEAGLDAGLKEWFGV